MENGLQPGTKVVKRNTEAHLESLAPKTNLLEQLKLTQKTSAPGVYRSGQVRSGTGQVRFRFRFRSGSGTGQVRFRFRSGQVKWFRSSPAELRTLRTTVSQTVAVVRSALWSREVPKKPRTVSIE